MMNKSTKDNKIALIIDSNTKTIYPTDIPKQFNKYFTELGAKLSSDIPQPFQLVTDTSLILGFQ